MNRLVDPKFSKVSVGAVPGVRLELKTSKRLVERVFPELVSKFPGIQWVYYPYPNLDVSPSVLFDDVLYVDTNKDIVSNLRRAGLKAYQAHVLDYRLDRKTDLLILLNPRLNEENTRQVVQEVKPRLILSHLSNPTNRNLGKIASVKFQTNLDKIYPVYTYVSNVKTLA